MHPFECKEWGGGTFVMALKNVAIIVMFQITADKQGDRQTVCS